MNASLLAVLNDAERLLVAQTEPAELAALDEDAAIEFEARIRRTRNKYVGQYRRGASAKVARGGRPRKGTAGEHAGRHEGRGVRRGLVPGQPPGRGAGPAVRSQAARGAAFGRPGRGGGARTGRAAGRGG